MRVFLLAFLCEAFISFILKGSLTEETRELLIFIYILVNSFIIIGWFRVKSKDKTIFIILTLGFLVRMAALFYDRNISVLPFNTMDANAFHNLAVETANALPNVMLEHYTGFYSQVLGVIYYIFGNSRVLGHFLNIVFIIFACTKLIDIGDLLKLRVKNQYLLLILWLFMPIPFLMSYALLREASIYYFIVLSIYFFLKWFEKYNPIFIILTLISAYISGLYHSGVLVIIIPYLYTFLFYNKKEKKIPVNIGTVVVFIAVLVLGYIYISKNGEELFNKTNADTGGGSTYLSNLDINTPFEFIIFAPIKGIYLIFSPMPWLIRNSLDMLTFVLDVGVWILTTTIIIKNRKNLDTKFKIMIITIIISCILFGMGTHNTGTAIRHRNKFCAFIIISYIYVKDRKEIEKINLNKK